MKRRTSYRVLSKVEGHEETVCLEGNVDLREGEVQFLRERCARKA